MENYFIQGRKGWVRLHEKGNKDDFPPCHHRPDEMLEAYMTQSGPIGSKGHGAFLVEKCQSHEGVNTSRHCTADKFRHNPFRKE